MLHAMYHRVPWKTLSLDKAGRYILKATALLPGDSTKKASAVNRKMVRGVSGDVMAVPGDGGQSFLSLRSYG
jgi:hypothetical protein